MISFSFVFLSNEYRWILSDLNLSGINYFMALKSFPFGNYTCMKNIKVNKSEIHTVIIGSIRFQKYILTEWALAS